MSRWLLPLLLKVVPDRSQQDRMTRLVREVLGETKLHVRITSQELWHECGPLAKIWTDVLPTRSEHTSRLRWFVDIEATNESVILTHE